MGPSLFLSAPHFAAIIVHTDNKKQYCNSKGSRSYFTEKTFIAILFLKSQRHI